MSQKHVVFFHQNYPAQFGPISEFLLKEHGCKITFFSEFLSKPPLQGIHHIRYDIDKTGEKENPYFFTRYFEREVRSMYGAYKALIASKISKPDVFVGHVGFGNLMFMHVAVPDVPTVGFFEIFYSPYDSQSHSRPQFPVPKENILRIPLRNATQIIELEYCTKGYSPTGYQRSTFPAAYQHKLATIFDGVNTNLYSPGEVTSASELPRTWPADAKIVTYVARGLEAMRGFDIFMEVAYQICQKRDDIHFVVAGNPQTHYGSEMITVKEQTFKDYVMKQRDYDLSRFHFLNWISEPALVDLYRISKCHFYWTVPFTLSWSFFQGLATGIIAIASNSPPVLDLIRDGENGFIMDPYDIDAYVDRILDVVDNQEKYDFMRHAGRETILKDYSLDVCLPRLADFYLSPAPTPEETEAALAARVL
jgi:glycosyltransferase involved in cell wall biosynthesis